MINYHLLLSIHRSFHTSLASNSELLVLEMMLEEEFAEPVELSSPLWAPPFQLLSPVPSPPLLSSHFVPPDPPNNSQTSLGLFFHISSSVFAQASESKALSLEGRVNAQIFLLCTYTSSSNSLTAVAGGASRSGIVCA